MFDFKAFISALLRKKPESPVDRLKSATVWVQELPDSEVQEAQEEIIKALGPLNTDKKAALKERIQILLRLDEKATHLQETLCREYLAHFDDADSPEKLYLPTILSFWEEMAESYQRCIRDFAQNPSNKKIMEMLPLLTARAMRYYAMQAKWSHLHYMPVDTHVWRNLHRLYLFAEREKFALTTLRLYPHYTGETTAASEYLQPHMLHLANPESLQPKQINMVDHWLDIWTNSITIESQFRPQRQIYAVNLGDGKPARKLRRNMLGEKYRYWGVGLLLVTISKTMDQLKNGELPIHLKLSEDCRLPACLNLIETLSDRWAGKGAVRKHERQKNENIVEVVQGLDDILQSIKPGGKPPSDRRQKSRPSAAEQHIINYQLSDMPGFTASGDTTLLGEPELFESDLNQWMMEDESISGYGAVFKANGKNPLKIGTLIGLKPDSRKHFAIGVVRRLNKDLSSKTHVGIQTLSQTPIAVELHPMLNGTARSSVLEAVYLPETPGSEIARSIIIPNHAYSRGQTMLLKAQGKTFSVRMQQVLEQMDDYARINFDVLAKY